jgi:hypothetical protein
MTKNIKEENKYYIMDTCIALCGECRKTDGGKEFISTIETLFAGIQPGDNIVPWTNYQVVKEDAPHIFCRYGQCCCPAAFSIRGEQRQHAVFCSVHKLKSIPGYNVNFRKLRPDIFRRRRNLANRHRKVMINYPEKVKDRRKTRRAYHERIKKLKKMHVEKIKLMIALSRNIISLKKQQEQAK